MSTAPHDDPVRRAWEANATFWDARMGEGNDFQNVLVWPATERLLALRSGERVLDVACGNGLTSRRMAALGAEVLGIDFCGPLIERARERTPQDLPIRYRVLDATDEAALRALGAFDAVQCSMALFDMAAIEPLLRAVAGMLRPGGRFVSSLLHPCFNNPSSVHTAELYAREDGSFETVFSVKISRYLASYEAGGLLDDPGGHLAPAGERSRHVRVMVFSSLDGIAARRAYLVALIGEAVEIERAGLRVAPLPDELEYVPELRRRLAADPALRAAFEQLTAGRRRAYNLHFTQPVQASTREARIIRATARILAGKGLGDCVCGHTEHPPRCDGSHKRFG